jgi:hypothetical protein
MVKLVLIRDSKETFVAASSSASGAEALAMLLHGLELANSLRNNAIEAESDSDSTAMIHCSGERIHSHLCRLFYYI